MASDRSGRSSPLSLLAVVLVLGTLTFMVRGYAKRSSAERSCERGADGTCVEAPRRPLPKAAAGSLGRPELAADTACRDVAYLCADLEKNGKVFIQRWRDFQGTMVVHVPLPNLRDAALAHDLQRAATAGVRLWNGHPFPILVDERGTRPAQIEVRWVPRLSGTEIGLAHVIWDSRRGLSVTSLDLVTLNPVRRGNVNPRDVRLTAMHEMGHALGLPHSDHPHDVMFPTNTATGLSARDFTAIEALYRLPDGVTIVP